MLLDTWTLRKKCNIQTPIRVSPANFNMIHYVLKILLSQYLTHCIHYRPNICSHTTTILTTHRCILMDCFNNCNFSKHKLMRSLMMVIILILVIKTTLWCISWWINKTLIMLRLQEYPDALTRPYGRINTYGLNLKYAFIRVLFDQH